MDYIIAGKSTYITKESNAQIETAEAVKYDGNNLDEVIRIVKAANYRMKCTHDCYYNSLYIEAIIKVNNLLHGGEDVFFVTPLITIILREGYYVVKTFIKMGISGGYLGFKIMDEEEFNEKFA